jgi:hypothetical protein
MGASQSSEIVHAFGCGNGLRIRHPVRGDGGDRASRLGQLRSVAGPDPDRNDQEMTYANPHGTLTLEVPGKTWTVTLAPPFRMQNRGLPPEALKAGTTVTVVGYPSRSDPSDLRAERITVGNQTTELR